MPQSQEGDFVYPISISYNGGSEEIKEFLPPEGVFYWQTAHRLEGILTDIEVPEDVKHFAYNTYMSIILMTAAWDKAIQDAPKISDYLQHKRPFTDMGCKQLCLFRQVKVFYELQGLSLPDILQNPQEAWAEVLLRDAQCFITGGSDLYTSKRQFIAATRDIRAKLSKRNNCIDANKQPELFALFEAFFDAPPVDSQWSNNVKHQRKLLSDAFKDYLRSLSTVCSKLDRDNHIVWFDRKNCKENFGRGLKRKMGALSIGGFEDLPKN